MERVFLVFKCASSWLHVEFSVTERSDCALWQNPVKCGVVWRWFPLFLFVVVFFFTVSVNVLAFMWRIAESVKGSLSSSCWSERWGETKRKERISRKARCAAKTSPRPPHRGFHIKTSSRNFPRRTGKENTVRLTCAIFADRPGMWVTVGPSRGAEGQRVVKNGTECEKVRLCVCVCDFNEDLLRSGQKKLWPAALSFDFFIRIIIIIDYVEAFPPCFLLMRCHLFWSSSPRACVLPRCFDSNIEPKWIHFAPTCQNHLWELKSDHFYRIINDCTFDAML